MKITFKNVGQGDTIILEWLDNETPKIGIIDCRRVAGVNPVIEHLKQVEWQSDIEFIILSHPHYDHFSGMSDLLDYCDEKSINITVFAHSFMRDQRYLDWYNFSEEGTNELRKLIEKVIRFEVKGRVKEIDLISSVRWSFPFGAYQLKSLSPTDDEIRAYTKKTSQVIPNDYRKASQAANLLSTMFMLEFDDGYALFTSDVETTAIDRILRKHMTSLENKKLALAQIPHHGSQRNHQIVFWENLQYKTNTPAVVSAGKHETYNHPKIQVIRDFDDSNYKIYATNDINGMADFLNENPRYLSDKLNMHNKAEIEYYSGTSRDIKFEIKYGAALLC